MDTFFFDNFLNLIFPPKCGYCGEITLTKQFVCNSCRNLLTQKYTNRCSFCGKISYNEKCQECSSKRLYYEKLIFCNEYTEELKQKMHLYKFGDKKFLCHFFSEILYEKVKDEEFDFIIPVPISKERYKERGYNQSGLIAKKLGKMLNKTCCLGILIKSKNSERQSMQTFKNRQQSVKNVFEIADNISVYGKTILLIDDIFTTGSTANECSKVLKKAGVKKVKVAVICISHTLK